MQNQYIPIKKAVLPYESFTYLPRVGLGSLWVLVDNATHLHFGIQFFLKVTELGKTLLVFHMSPLTISFTTILSAQISHVAFRSLSLSLLASIAKDFFISFFFY